MEQLEHCKVDIEIADRKIPNMFNKYEFCAYARNARSIDNQEDITVVRFCHFFMITCKEY
uniref:Uncharacterized protein n=1 Tax=Romanomermis culicivorax TaxID=13658 RepID=A0A915IA54_ROMCU